MKPRKIGKRHYRCGPWTENRGLWRRHDRKDPTSPFCICLGWNTFQDTDVYILNGRNGRILEDLQIPWGLE